MRIRNCGEDEDVDIDGVILTSVEVRMGLDDVDPGLVLELLPSNKFPETGAVLLFVSSVFLSRFSDCEVKLIKGV